MFNCMSCEIEEAFAYGILGIRLMIERRIQQIFNTKYWGAELPILLYLHMPRITAPRRPDNADKFSFFNRKRQVLERLGLAVKTVVIKA